MRLPPDQAIPRQSIATYHDFLKSLLNGRDRLFEEVVEGVGLASKLRYAVVTIVALAGFFGLVAGAYSGPAQAVSAAVKLPFLFFATFAVCFPAFFVVQVLVGSRLRLLQVAVLVFGALALACVLLAAFVPITAFFLITGANYYFQHLLNITIAGIAGLFGMYALHEGLSLVCEKRAVYPRKASPTTCGSHRRLSTSGRSRSGFRRPSWGRSGAFGRASSIAGWTSRFLAPHRVSST